MRTIYLFIWLMLWTKMVIGQDILVLSDTVTCFTDLQHKTDTEGSFYSFKSLSEISDTSDTTYYYKYDIDSALVWRRTLSSDSILHEDYSVHNSTGSVVCHTDSAGKKIYLTRYSKSGDKIWGIQSATIDSGKVYDLKIHTGTQGNIYLAISQSGNLSIDTLNIIKPDTLNGYRHILISFSEYGEAQWYRSTSTLSKDSLVLEDLNLFTDENGQVYLIGSFEENFSLAGIQVIKQGKTSNHYLSSFSEQGYLSYLTKTGNTQNSLKDGRFMNLCQIEGSDIYLKYQFDMDGLDSSLSVLGNHIIYRGTHTIKISPPKDYADIIYRINCGGEFIESPYKNWLEDRQLQPIPYLDLESSNHTTGTIDQWNNSNNTSAPDNVFGNNRYDRPYGGDLKYHFPLEPGTYYINLYFAEKPNTPGVSGAGERIFDVHFNGELVIKDLDIYKEAGLHALQIPVLYTNLSDSLTISFNRKVYDPQINGIEIIANYPANLKNFPLSIPEYNLEAKNKILVSNPFSGSIRIFSHEDLGKATISLHSIDGNLLFSNELKIRGGKSTQIPTESGWGNGFYILRINERSFPILKAH